MQTSSEGDLLGFLYACPVGLIECDAAGVIGMINPYAMQHLLSLAGHHNLGNLFEALEAYAPELRQIVAGATHPVGRICDGHRIPIDLESTDRKTGPKVLSTTIVKIGPNRFMVTLSDVTVEAAREQRLAEAEATNLAKSQFLANMSHELRTPLNGVLGMAQALALETLSPSQHEKVQTIRDSGRSLLVLLNDILDISEIEAGQLGLKIKPFNLVQIINSTCTLFAETAKIKSLPVIFVIRDEVRGLWEGDANRCRQILSYLLDNAIKFTEAGQVRVELERSGKGAVRLSVSDTGVGISAADVPKLFSRFYQSDTSTTRRFGGAGLGLSICKELAQIMGGTIIVESVRGEGSTFTVDLPLRYIGVDAEQPLGSWPGESSHDQYSRQQATGRLVNGPIAQAEAAGTLQILVAEDNPTNQLILKTLLQVFDVSVVTVANGRLAVEAWESGAFDLILMDVQMPDMDGVAATQRIRALEKRLGRTRTPIVAVTANFMAHQVEEYRRAGMDGHVAKPIQLEALCEALGSTRTDLRQHITAQASSPESSSHNRVTTVGIRSA